MNPFYYFAFFSAYFFSSFYFIAKKDIFFATIYLFLFIYCIFALIGYVYIPELSMVWFAYFGTKFIEQIFIFIILSFVSFGTLFFILQKRILQKNLFTIVYGQDKFEIFTILYVIHFLFQSIFLYLNWDIITYENVASQEFEKSQGVAYLLFILQFKHLMIPLNLVLYILWRAGSKELNYTVKFINLIKLMWSMHFLLMLFISNRNGSRTDLLSLFIDITVFEYVYNIHVFYLKFRFILKYCFIFIMLIIVVSMIPGTRDLSKGDLLFYEKILFQDYFPPAHVLFAAIANNYIEPILVFQSNFCNSLFKLNFPYLQAFVMETFYPTAATRNASMAFYIFTEGFMVLGNFGFLYNGIVIIFGATMWRRLASSNSHIFNMFMLSMITGRVTTIVRGQSSYFFKDFYTFFIPAIILFYMATGLHPKIIKFLYS